MNSFSKLIELFSQFPGIGPRQAKRFVYFLLTQRPAFLNELTRLIAELQHDMKVCRSCFRIFSHHGGDASLCSICGNKSRDHSLLAVVSRDSDLENFEKSGSFNGVYFVLGGTVPILEQEPEKRIRSKELLKNVQEKIRSSELKEIILAMSFNAEGENTADYLRGQLTPLLEKSGIKISTLGRGLSTGTELEYSDAETLTNAMKNRA